ncbi:hypothetical protein [Acinetobacter baumannii]|uniref:Lipoprotein n=2 Tax=Acinetobacter baumannii TaxID=470 RepID=A0A7X1VKT9_ACIBA|nr:hypothetical protein [Acinetobacter baumannii]ALJ88466.1 putative membrane protein [Acinetobacter baumannii]EGJ58583.1 hypothetical protein HMPREF0021_03774 [Acinetobacter baumannii 6013150]EGJ63622.1 hypothetical protein HMPREF0020_02742 [Acinetobacter baumannii 6013113]EHU1796839.1 hypothetical protein [Acinetobacter baumannii]EHU2743424.1 hypothetical protein [Acinetobacter baumannii]
MFKDILRRFAFLFVFLPALPAIWYGCQYAFYLGQTEAIGAKYLGILISPYNYASFEPRSEKAALYGIMINLM